ncbi:MAG TPA: sigma-70 family RNA polymerase sigma factor [Anaeromyxobacteraceae bacterium]|nr:sigma-70 family RNA polymerase sigma factor [Anaeromyxobacteraceae bacterium]
MRGDDAGSLRRAAERAKDGSTAAFRELVDRTHATVFRLAAALTGDRDEAADVTQETYVRAWERIGELRDPAAASGWLFRIARNVARDRRGSWWSRIRAPLDPAAEERAAAAITAPATAQERLEAAETAGAVQRALRKLPEKHRVVLQLREIEGMTEEEIAEALGVPVGTVESRLHRARAGLARRLAPLAKEDLR